MPGTFKERSGDVYGTFREPAKTFTKAFRKTPQPAAAANLGDVARSDV
jgi:hypothetical protein